MAKYWFARLYPVEQVRNTRVAPITSEGWAVVALFAGCLVAGAAGLFLFAFAYGAPAFGVVTFVGFSLAGGVAFVTLVMLRSDKAHTVGDYRSGKVRQP